MIRLAKRMISATIMTAAIAIGLGAVKSQIPTPWPLGSFALGAPGAPARGCPTGFTCYNFTTTCPNVAQTQNGNGHIAIMRPAGAARQLDIFFPGAGGKFWSDPAPTLTIPFMQQLSAVGHILVQVQWGSNVWYSAAPGERPGPKRLASRPATVLKWVHDNWLPQGVRYVATGTSAGASAISYSLTTYGLDSIVDLLVPTSGPPHAMIAYNCLNPSPDDALGGSGEHIIDGSYGFFNGTGPCYVHNPAWTQTWNDDSVETGGINYFWPNTKVHFIIGGRDSKGIRNDATALLNVLIKNGTAATYELAPATPHEMQKSQDGLNAIWAALTGTPRPKPNSY